MKIHWDIDQNSAEWDYLRLGKLTGSNAHLFLVNGRSDSGLGAGAISYIYQKAAERVTMDNPYRYSNQFTDRGHDMELLAVLEYQNQTFEIVDRPGFVERDSFTGCSPDGLVGSVGMIEIKCPEQAEYMRIVDLREGAIDKKYIAQVQFNLWVCGREWCDLVYYHPKFEDKKLIRFQITPDEKMHKRFEWAAQIFRQKVETLTAKVLKPESAKHA